MSSEFSIAFPGVSQGKANRYAESLSSALRETYSDVRIERRRTREDTQDFGASLSLILGTAAATEIAKGIAAWLKRNSGARIEISADGRVLAENLGENEAPEIARVISAHLK